MSSEDSVGSGHSWGSNGAGFTNSHVEVDLSGFDDNEDLGTHDSFGTPGHGSNDRCVADVMATNLLELNSGRHEKLRIAFQDWEKTLEKLRKRSLIWESKQDTIRNEIYQVIGFYIVFQGVIFTAVLQKMSCDNWWTSLLLSLLTSLVTTVAVLQKLSQILKLETTMASEKASTEMLETRVNNVILHVGPGMFDFRVHAADVKSSGNPVMPPGVKLYAFALVTVLLCFSSIFIFCCWLHCLSVHY